MENIVQFIFRYGESGLIRWCKTYPDLVSEDLALALKEHGDRTFGEKDYKIAKHFYYQSSVIWRVLGQPDQEIRILISYLDCLFLLTNDSWYYKVLARKAREKLRESRTSKYFDSAFCLATLEAECWWFEGSEVQTENIDTYIKVLNRMPRLPEVKAVRSRAWFERFISLSAAIASVFRDLESSGTATAHLRSKMKSLAQKIKVHTHDGFEYKLRPSNTRKTVFALAHLLARFGDDNFAHYLLSQEARRSMSLGDTEGIMQSLAIRYIIALKSTSLPAKRIADLREDFLSALKTIRNSFRSRAGRIYNTGERQFCLGDPLRELIENVTNESEIFSLNEFAKAQALLERTKGLYTSAPGKSEHQIYELEQQLLCTEASTNIEDALLLSKNDLALWQGNQPAENMRMLERLYAQTNSGFTDTLDTYSVSELQKYLEEGDLLIELVIPYDPMYPNHAVCFIVIDHQRVILINPEKELKAINGDYKGMIGFMQPEKKQRLDVSPLNNLIFQTRSAILTKSMDEKNNLLAKLSRLILQSIESAGFVPEEYRCWHIIPSGVFHYVPFAALTDNNGKFLIERVALTVTPSAAIWAHLAGKQRKKPTRAIAYGNPSIMNEDLSSLKNAKKEVEKIKTIFSSVEWEVNIDTDATEEHFKKNAPGNDIVHIASHGLFSVENAIDSSGIILSSSSNYDGLLRADEIYQMDLSNVQIFILSICNGSVYRFGPGDEPFGIVPALISAGVGNIVGTLWPLEDAIGRQMMVDFYKALRQVGPAQALKKAACLMIEAKANIGQWASFSLCGSGRGWDNL